MKKYQIIYADPPWSYKDKNEGQRKYGKITPYYSGMSVEDICNLPVGGVSDENCILFLWATFPNLPEALEVIKAWGFQYKTLGFSWIKLNRSCSKMFFTEKDIFFGIGHYTKSNCECCLIGLKGQLKYLKQSNKVSSVILSPLRKHSQKPEEAKNKIVEMCGNLPRIELFARQKTEGWNCIGNDINGKDIKQELEEIING